MPKLLLVEDNEINRDMLARRLERKGFSIVFAVNGAEGVEKAKSENPDLILMDMSLPVMDGWTATRQLKACLATRTIPVIALTAHALASDRAKALEAGCDEYETKPVNFMQLLAKIEQFLGQPARPQNPVATERPPEPSAPAPSLAKPNVPNPAEAPPSESGNELLAPGHGNLKHRIRKPLSHIIGYGEILEEEAAARPNGLILGDLRVIHQIATEALAGLNRFDLTGLDLSRARLDEWSSALQSVANQIITAAEKLAQRCDREGILTFSHDLRRMAASAAELREIAERDIPQLADRVGPKQMAAAARSGVDTAKAPGPSETQPARREQGRILVVDDDRANRDILWRRLSPMGYEVVLAVNGRDALAQVATDAIDLVLLDILMPQLDGFEVLKQLKADPATQNIPVIMLSAVDDIETVVRCIELGADDYLPKPFPTPLLRARVRACLSNKRLSDQLRKYTEWLFGKTLFSQAVGSPHSLTLARKERSVLFADIRGFTQWTENANPEEVVQMLNRYFEAAEKIWRPSQIIKVEYTGDEIMGVFPNTEAALQVAFALQQRAGMLLRNLDLDLGIGVHAGPVIEGIMGSTDVKSYCFVGDTINSGRRICDEAAGGQILISAPAYAIVRDTVEVGPPIDLRAKGKAEPLRVYPLLQLRSA